MKMTKRTDIGQQANQMAKRQNKRNQSHRCCHVGAAHTSKLCCQTSLAKADAYDIQQKLLRHCSLKIFNLAAPHRQAGEAQRQRDSTCPKQAHVMAMNKVQLPKEDMVPRQVFVAAGSPHDTLYLSVCGVQAQFCFVHAVAVGKQFAFVCAQRMSPCADHTTRPAPAHQQCKSKCPRRVCKSIDLRPVHARNAQV